MSARPRRTALVPGLLTAALLLTACATGSEPAPAQTSASPSTPQATSAQPSVAPPAAPSSSEPEETTPSPTGETPASEPAALVTVSALATAPNGAQLLMTLTLDSLPTKDRDLLDEALAACYLEDDNWPSDTGRARLWEQTIRSEPVPGTPRWPANQQLRLLTLAAQGVASGDGFGQIRTTSGAKALCMTPDANITLRGPGTVRLVLFTAPSSALTGAGSDDLVAVGQYGFYSGIGKEEASSLSECVVTVSPEVEEIRARVGQRWRVFAEYAPWDYADFCGIGVPNEEVP